MRVYNLCINSFKWAKQTVLKRTLADVFLSVVGSWIITGTKQPKLPIMSTL